MNIPTLSNVFRCQALIPQTFRPALKTLEHVAEKYLSNRTEKARRQRQ